MGFTIKCHTLASAVKQLPFVVGAVLSCVTPLLFGSGRIAALVVIVVAVKVGPTLSPLQLPRATTTVTTNNNCCCHRVSGVASSGTGIAMRRGVRSNGDGCSMLSYNVMRDLVWSIGVQRLGLCAVGSIPPVQNSLTRRTARPLLGFLDAAERTNLSSAADLGDAPAGSCA